MFPEKSKEQQQQHQEEKFAMDMNVTRGDQTKVQFPHMIE